MGGLYSEGGGRRGRGWVTRVEVDDTAVAGVAVDDETGTVCMMLGADQEGAKGVYVELGAGSVDWTALVVAVRVSIGLCAIGMGGGGVCSEALDKFFRSLMRPKRLAVSSARRDRAVLVSVSRPCPPLEVS